MTGARKRFTTNAALEQGRNAAGDAGGGSFVSFPAAAPAGHSPAVAASLSSYQRALARFRRNVAEHPQPGDAAAMYGSGDADWTPVEGQQ
jgi:hypothetical protein